jgi:hypothetical protein
LEVNKQNKTKHTKQNQKEKQKEKQTNQKPGQLAIEPRISSLPDKIWHQFSHGDGDPTVTRPLHDR